MKALFCVGDSHLTSLDYGFQRRLATGTTGEFSELRRVLSGYFIDPTTKEYIVNAAFDAEFQKQMEGIEVSAVFLYLGGAEHSFMSLGRPWPFDFFLPDGPYADTVDLDTAIIPFEVMLATCRATMSRTIPMVMRIKSLTDLPMYHILPPPPPVSDEHILAFCGSSFKDFIARHGLTPGYIRQKVWHTCQRAARQMYGEMGVPVIEPPEETFSEAGLLQPFWSDAVHANPTYSALLVDRLVSVAASHLGKS